jgi:hypothetical protein
MLERYGHVRMEAKRTAMDPLAVSTKTAAYDTNRHTKAVAAKVRPAKLLGDLVDLVGIEPTTSSMPLMKSIAISTT